MLYFTSDTHFNHENIIGYCNRPFKNVNEMNEAIIDNWNSIVKSDDIIYHLGDFAFGPKNKDNRYYCFEKIYRQLHGYKRLILGSHDWKDIDIYKKLFGIDNVFEEEYFFAINGVILVLNHQYDKDWIGKDSGAVHLFGHSHGKLNTNDAMSMDVGVDCHDFKPVSIVKVLEKFKL